MQNKKTLAILLVIVMVVSLFPGLTGSASTSSISLSLGSANDGVDFTGLANGTNYAYYGKLRHATKVGGGFYYGETTALETNATPMLWQIMGEELDANNNGDGKISMLSRYVVGGKLYENATNDTYIKSNASAWLNSSDAAYLGDVNTPGFLYDTFNSSENKGALVTNVTCAKFDASKNEITSETATGTWPKYINQKIYLPWGTVNGTKLSAPDIPTLYWSAGKVLDKNMVSATMAGQMATLKNGVGSSINYWTRTQAAASTYALAVNHAVTGAAGTLFPQMTTGENGKMGLRPIFKLDPSSVLFASEIKTTPGTNPTYTTAIAPNLIEGTAGTHNYKLTVLGDDGYGINPNVMSILGKANNSYVTASPGGILSLTTNDPSCYGYRYSINYKIVKQNTSSRDIVGYGQLASDAINATGMDTAIDIPINDISGGYLPVGYYDLYVWLQKNNADTSNEASQPVHLTLGVEGDTPIPTPSPIPSPSPSVSPSASPSPSVAPSVSPSPSVAPSVAPSVTPTPTAPPAAKLWNSTFYPGGTGYNDNAQFAKYIVNKGSAVSMNKVILDHDSSMIMSFSISTSLDGNTYTPVTDVYPGGVSKYSGKQIYRFASKDAMYVKYGAVLLGTYATQARLDGFSASNTTTTAMSFIDVPDTINPIDTSEIILSVNASDSDGDTYTMPTQGVVYELEGTIPSGVALNGNVITIDQTAPKSTFTIKATDSSGAMSISKSITVDPQVNVRNFALYADQGGTIPLTSMTGGSEVYARINAKSATTVDNKNVELVMAVYENINGNKKLVKVSMTSADVPVATDYQAFTAKITLPTDITSDAYIKCFAMSKDILRPYSDPIIFSPSAAETGLSAQNIFLDKADTFTLKASMPSGNLVWMSSNEKVATVNENGVVTGTGEGKAVITAKVDGTTVGSTTVKVKPSIYVYLMMGQSNCAGNNTPLNEGVTDQPISEGVMLLNKSNVFEPAQHKYSRHSGVHGDGAYTDASTLIQPHGGINMGYTFANDFKADNEGTQIGLIVNSLSGCRIEVFDRVHPEQPTANGFENSVARVALATNGHGELKGILWHQGESNGGDLNYTYRFRNVMYDFRKEFGNMELPIVAGGLNENLTDLDGNVKYGATSIKFNDELKAQEQNMAAFGFASVREPYLLIPRALADPNFRTDYSHFSVLSQMELGHRYYIKFNDIASKNKGK